MSTTERIARAFADAVAAGDLEAAEGWVTVAALRAERSADARPRSISDPAKRRSFAGPQ
ncbi:MAG: hypothetical protein ACRDHI_04115 [Actinomycetota bacterium]